MSEKSKPRKTWHHYIVPDVLHPIKFYPTQVSYGQKIVNACPIDDRVTRPLSPSVIPNDEGSELCAVDGWIYEGWEHVTGTLSKLFG